ncbi:uncharacterized protein LOC128670194 [Plodia interpunctella]|uniref:uncharacterized protein LOC128670194 n=1 Tax=Plodia interpunctella TaxID=58824 RepID=UPI002367A16F|nr:uncharacterized protein LOC128670194 [Plodia interpunctella]
MTSSFDDSVLNFDLGFLNQTSKNIGFSKLEKQRKAILLVKKKTITTDGLIKKYFNKKEVLEQTERSLSVSKEECKQVCIDYKNVLEKCERLENEIQVVHQYNQQLQLKLSDVENQFNALQSHAKQLEVLVKEQETKIESQKIENHLGKTSSKNSTNITNVQKQNDILLRDLCILGGLLLQNKNLKPQYVNVLKKYENYLKKHDDDSSNDSGDGNSDNEIDLSEEELKSPQSPLCLKNNKHKIHSSSVEVQEVIVVNVSSAGKDDTTSKPSEIDRCSVYSNDVASADTGRGSSLAFSDSEKCFRSPDYLSNDNSPEFICKSTMNSVGTSPILDTIDTATSPINFESQTDFTYTFNEEVSPFRSTGIENVPPPTEVCSSQAVINHPIQDKPNNQYSNTQAEECLQVNSSSHYEDEYSRDGEIEMILSKMQFNRDLITPMPSSPCSSQSTVTSIVSACQTNHDDFIICRDAAKLKEENKILHANITDLAKEIKNIKSILKMNPTASLEKNINQGIAEISMPTCGNNKIIEDQLDNHNENLHENHNENLHEDHNENDDLTDMVDLVQICDSEDMSFNDFCDLETREDMQNDEGAFNTLIPSSQEEDPIIVIEEQENPPEGIMSRLEFEEDPSSIESTPDKFNDINSNVSNETAVPQNSVENLGNNNERLRRRLRKLNNLEKFRRKMVPKSKIRREYVQSTRKRLIKKSIGKSVKHLKLKTLKKKVTLADTSASLNDKTVYDKAVKIMSELKVKQSEEPNNKSLTPKQTEKSLDSPEIRKSVKKRLLDVSKLALDITEKPFDISDLISKQTPRPVIKSVTVPRETQKSVCFDEYNTQSLKNMQPIIRIDKLLDITERSVECIDKSHNIENTKGQQSLSPSVITRSRSRFVENLQTLNHEPSASESMREVLPKESKKRLKRVASDGKQEFEHKRILRSSTRLSMCENNTKINNNNNTTNTCNKENNSKSPKVNINCKNEKKSPVKNEKLIDSSKYNSAISYDDLDMFSEQEPMRNNILFDEVGQRDSKDSILCTMLEKYGLSKVKFYPKKIPDEITNTIHKEIEDSIKHINELKPREAKSAMACMIDNLQSWNVKQFLTGLMKYLQDPERKVELYSKVNSPPAPPMSKSEQILLYIVMQLRNVWSNVDIVNHVLSSIEYTMFKLNRTPEFDTVESMSHFYAILCRYFKMKTRLRLFMLDAMYCMQFKAIALIRQCMDVWMHVLPLAHMGIAKNPLVTCVVYLLHFYKCEDNFNRVQDIRNILSRKYSYQISEWNETKILDMFRNAIYELRDIPVEKKMLRLSLIILAKRQGARWCQKNIIANMIQPIIENKDAPSAVKQFCVSMIGPLVKPYPVDMKVHCEIIMNLLLDMRKENPSPPMEEAIFTSLMYMCKHNQNRVVGALLKWHPKRLSSECQEVIRDFVRDKPANTWKSIIKRIYSMDTLNEAED